MINLYDNKVYCKSCKKPMPLERAIEFNGFCEKCYNEQLFTITFNDKEKKVDVNKWLRSRRDVDK